MSVTFGTYNLHFKLSPEQVGYDLAKLIDSTYVSVLGLQEMGNNERVPMLSALSGRGWQFTRPDDLPYQKQVPLGWDTQVWAAERIGSQRISSAIHAEPGAGGAFIESKWATFAILRSYSTGKRAAVINWHAPASVENPANVLRRESMQQCTASVLALACQFAPYVSGVFIAGDMNVDYRKKEIRQTPGFPVAVFRSEGFRANWSAGRLPLYGTHKRRLIDYLFSNARIIKTKALAGYSSDHRPVLAEYKF